MKPTARPISRRLAVGLIALALALAACGTTVGPEGPEGPPGPAGPPGSANVTQYNFAAFVHNGIEQSFTIPIAYADAAEHLVLLYVLTSAGFWYPLSGEVTSSYYYRTYLGPTAGGSATNAYMARTLGAGDHSFDAARVIVIPASTVVPAAASLDWNSYEAVSRHFGLDD